MKIALELQKLYFNENKTKDIVFRKETLTNLYNNLENFEQEIFDAFKKDLGKSEFESYTTELGYIKKSITHTLKNLNKWTKRKKVKTPWYLFGNKSYIYKEPLGHVLIISSFNYPLQLLFEPLIGAVASGNVVSIKPSEYVPNINKVIRKIIESSFARGHVNIYEGGVEVTQSLLEYKYDHIFFTGSEKVGKIVYQKASQHLTPVTLELGGKSPAIIFEDANIYKIIDSIIWGKFTNAGQTCVAPDYVLVEASQKDKFIKAAIASIQKLYGHNIEENSDYGRIISKRHHDRLINLRDLHANDIVYGGEAKGLYFEPTLLDIKDISSPIMSEEIFGPILPIITFDKSPIEVIKVHKDPLALYVFTDDKKKYQKIINEVPFGGGMVNNTLMHLNNPNLPFGGRGSSGIGKYHGSYSIDTFSHTKSIMFSNFKFKDSLVLPPFKNKLSIIKKILK